MFRYVCRILIRQAQRGDTIALWSTLAATSLLSEERDRWFLWFPTLCVNGIYFQFLTEPAWITVLAHSSSPWLCAALLTEYL
jgi:hypothetical protein